MEHNGLHYDVWLKIRQLPHQLNPITLEFSGPFVATIIIGGEEMTVLEPSKSPTIPLDEAKAFVEGKLLEWEHLGVFGAHLSRRVV